MPSSTDCPPTSPEKFAHHLLKLFPPSEVKRVVLGSEHAEYQTDPVGFCEKHFREQYTDDVKAMMESVRDYPITIAKSANATGKSHGAARVAAWWYKVFEDCQVYTAAAPPEDNLKRILWGQIGDLIERHPKLFAQDRKNILNMSKGPQAFLAGVTIPSSGTDKQREAKFSGKHAPHLLFILDEGDAIPDEVYRGIESCMSGGHARLLIMFNPRAEHGEVYRMERDKRANVVHLSAFSHPNVVTGSEVIPGAVNRETTVRRINEWCRPWRDGDGGEKDTFELPEFLVGTTANSTDGGQYPPLEPGEYVIEEPSFSYMVLGRYPAQGTNQLISREWVGRARARWDAYVADKGEEPPTGVRAIMGLDVADDGADQNVAYLRYGGFIPRPKRWSGVDLDQTEERASKIYHARDVYQANIDGTGLGAGVAPHMRKLGCNAHKIKVAESPTKGCEFGQFRILRDQLLWEVREWLKRDKGAMLPPEEMLLEELLVPTYRDHNGKIEVMRKDVMKEHLKRSSNDLDALALTFADSDTLLDPLDLEGCAE
jgi:hypothetical protein